MKKITIIIGAGASADFKLKTAKNNDISQDNQDYIRMPCGEELTTLISCEEKGIEEHFYFPFFCDLIEKWNKKSKVDGTSYLYEIGQYNKNLCAEALAEYFFGNICNDNQKSHNDKLQVNGFDEEENLFGQIKEEKTRFCEAATTQIKEILGKWEKNQQIADTDKISEIIYYLFNEFFKESKNQTVKAEAVRKYIHSQIQKEQNFKIYFEFCNLVKYYQPFSIDELLDSIQFGKVEVQPGQTASTPQVTEEKAEEALKNYRTELVTAGKELIALFLLRAEDEKVFTNQADCWYRHLRNLIITSGKNKDEIKTKLKGLTIISFNYDRSLDYYLGKFVGQNFYKMIKDRILYPYEKLAGSFSWENSDFDDIPYGSYKNGSYKKNKDYESKAGKYKDKNDFFENAKKLGQNLRIIGESDKNDKNSAVVKSNQDAKDAIDNAMKLDDKSSDNKFYFLGFGFHEQNCEIIHLEKIKIYLNTQNQHHAIYYTNFRNSKKIEQILNNYLSGNSDNRSFENYKFKFSSDKGLYEALLYDFDLSL